MFFGVFEDGSLGGEDRIICCYASKEDADRHLKLIVAEEMRIRQEIIESDYLLMRTDPQCKNKYDPWCVPGGNVKYRIGFVPIFDSVENFESKWQVLMDQVEEAGIAHTLIGPSLPVEADRCRECDGSGRYYDASHGSSRECFDCRGSGFRPASVQDPISIVPR